MAKQYTPSLNSFQVFSVRGYEGAPEGRNKKPRRSISNKNKAESERKIEARKSMEEQAGGEEEEELTSEQVRGWVGMVDEFLQGNVPIEVVRSVLDRLLLEMERKRNQCRKALADNESHLATLRLLVERELGEGEGEGGDGEGEVAGGEGRGESEKRSARGDGVRAYILKSCVYLFSAVSEGEQYREVLHRARWVEAVLKMVEKKECQVISFQTFTHTQHTAHSTQHTTHLLDGQLEQAKERWEEG